MLDRVFYSNDQVFLINPTIAVYAGFQYFYREYYSTSRLGNRKSQGNGQGTGISEPSVSTLIEIKDVFKFNILNVELSSPLQYYYKQFIFSLSPILALPQTSTTTMTEDELITEDLQSTFYFSAGIRYWFDTKKEKDEHRK
ncbi:MAG: hypothetical protein ACJART_000419 [Maribacter sp.]